MKDVQAGIPPLAMLDAVVIQRAIRYSSVNRTNPYRVLRLAWEESRPIVQVTIVGRFLAGSLLVWPAPEKMRWQVPIATIAWLAAGVAVYLFNGAADAVEDRANASTRPIASGRVANRDALLVVQGTIVLSLALSATTGIIIQAVTFLMLGYAYSGPPFLAKGHWAAASICIGASGAVTFWAASQAVGHISAEAIIAGAALAAWMGLVGALVKDLSDTEGDRISGRKTYAVVFGEYRTGRYAAAFALIIGLLASVASARLTPFALPVMVTLLAGGILIAIRSNRNASSARRYDARAQYRIFMLTQHVAVLVLIAPGFGAASTSS